MYYRDTHFGITLQYGNYYSDTKWGKTSVRRVVLWHTIYDSITIRSVLQWQTNLDNTIIRRVLQWHTKYAYRLYPWPACFPNLLSRCLSRSEMCTEIFDFLSCYSRRTSVWNSSHFIPFYLQIFKYLKFRIPQYRRLTGFTSAAVPSPNTFNTRRKFLSLPYFSYGVLRIMFLAP